MTPEASSTEEYLSSKLVVPMLGTVGSDGTGIVDSGDGDPV